MSDEVIVCVDCKNEFTFTENEASFFASKGLVKPRRCKGCRQKRRDMKAADGGTVSGNTIPVPQRRTEWIGGNDLPVAPRRNRKKDRRFDDSGF